MTNRKLLLFDIDGTLITSGGAGEQALCEAMRRRFGVSEDLSGITLAGATDALIARALLEKHGLSPSPENCEALLDAYLGCLSVKLPQHSGRVLPGILELLQHLSGNPAFVLALLTGNLAQGAKLKLTHYGVWDFFEFGAFADDHSDRNELGHFARARALEAHGEDFPPERIYVIGDTPRDIACGKAIGAKTVAVATGNFPPSELAAHDPDLLFADLSDIHGVIRALME